MLLLTPSAFELAICDLLTEMGFRSVQRVGGAGDLSVGITASDKKGRKTAVQCKRYAPENRVSLRSARRTWRMLRTGLTNDVESRLR